MPLSSLATVHPGDPLPFGAHRDYLAKADVSLRIALTTKLGLRTSYAWSRDSTPAPGVLSEDDRTLTTALLIQW